MVRSGSAQIRKGVRGDKKLIAQIYATCFDAAWAITAVDDLLKSMGCWALILETTAPETNAPVAVGFVLARSVVDEAEILSIGINPDFHRRGFAKKLMQKAIIEAKNRRGASMFLEVAEDNAPARALYDNLGFEVIGRRKGYYLKADRRRVDALNLRLKIT